MKHILIVDDEPTMLKALRISLEQEGFQVTLATDGREALDKVAIATFDLIVLDLMMPRVDGLTVCREVRKHSKVPIIMLTAKDEDIDKILGLEVGADDYVTKPFNTRELLARIKAVFRRIEDWSRPEGPKEIRAGRLVLLPLQRQAELDGRFLALKPREYDLLELMASQPRRVFTRQQLLDLVWGYDFGGDDRTVDVHVRRIREKIEADPSDPRILMTRRGVGYCLEVPQ